MGGPVQMSDQQTSDQQTSDQQTSDQQTSDTTKVGQYKRWTNNRRTGTKVELRHTSDQCKRWTSAKVGPEKTSDWYNKEKRRTFVEFENKIIHCYKK